MAGGWGLLGLSQAWMDPKQNDQAETESISRVNAQAPNNSVQGLISRELFCRIHDCLPPDL
jgi:hypothetical protein